MLVDSDDRAFWVCYECIRKKTPKVSGVCTWHMSKCEACNQYVAITHIRNYNYPDIKKYIEG